jgi:hypothetical protein
VKRPGRLSAYWLPHPVEKHMFVDAAPCGNSRQLTRAPHRTVSILARLSDKPCRIENVCDNLEGMVFRQGSNQGNFGAASPNSDSSLSARIARCCRSPASREWPVHPKPAICGTSLERRISTKTDPQSGHLGRGMHRRSTNITRLYKRGHDWGHGNNQDEEEHTYFQLVDHGIRNPSVSAIFVTAA